MHNIRQNSRPHYLTMMPGEAVLLSVEAVLAVLEQEHGSSFYAAFEGSYYPGPARQYTDCSWIKHANTVGINVRTLGDFWSIIPYALTLPAAQNAIHLLPIFEPGVVSSLYAPTSWNINPEFFSTSLAAFFPHLNTVEKQLSLTIRLLHLMGKSVGLDVIPHVDRYAEPVLANPSYFEWIRREDMVLTDHSNELHLQVRSILYRFLLERGSVVSDTTFPTSEADFFEQFPEVLRLRMMFGEKYEYAERLANRVEMVDLLYRHGFETLPATMGPPYRGIEVDPQPDAKIIDSADRVWRDYRMLKPQKFSRVFGPLTRYKLYEPRHQNLDWALDFDRPFVPAWEYVAAQYNSIQAEFDFDFMRGDMSHVQMRPGGTPALRDDYYDLLGAVKQSILANKPYFGYFAESFLAPPGEMAYGDECDHLEASFADSTLGDLQSEPMGTKHFVQEFARYWSLLKTRFFAPVFTVMTADKDDPRFDAYYLTGNETRYFMALFLTDMPSYMGLGFEVRDPHPTAAPNEHYTKLYVFQVDEGPKHTRGPYVWGRNHVLYEKICLQKLLANDILPGLSGAKTYWLLPPDPAGNGKVVAWTQALQPAFVFIVNMSQIDENPDFTLIFPVGQWRLRFSSVRLEAQIIVSDEVQYHLMPGECLVWQKVAN